MTLAIDREHGKVLRLQTPGVSARDVAVDLLGFLEGELEAEIEDIGWRSGSGLKVAQPVLIKLEGLEAELATDGNDVVVRRVAGSVDEFEELCDLLVNQCRRD
jgi:hypothetical protein